MAITSSIKIKGYVQGYGAGRMEIDTTPFTDSTALPSVQIGVVIGDNTITVPTGSSAVIISLDPVLSTGELFLKGVAGDTGRRIFSIGLGGTIFFPVDSTVASFVINSTAAIPSIKFSFL